MVVAHGTDTMEESALWLDLTYAGIALVVLTGAMRSADAADADGPVNLRDVVAVAASPAARGLGVLVRSLAGAATAGHAQGGYPGSERLRRDLVGTTPGGVAYRRQDPPLPGQLRAATHRGSTSSRPTWAVIRWRWTLVWPPEREPSCWRLGLGHAGLAVVDGVRRHCADGIVVGVSTPVPGGRVSAAMVPATPSKPAP